MRAVLHRVVGLSVGLFAVFAHAEPPVPATLEPWRPWVMHGQEFRACPLLIGKQGAGADDQVAPDDGCGPDPDPIGA